MDYKDKTAQILALLDRRTTIHPKTHPTDPRLAQLDFLQWEEVFSTFKQKHMEEATKLIKIFLNAVDFNDFMRLAEEVRTLENDDLFLYALYTAVLRRDDCRGITMPRIEECAPHWFFAAETIHEAIQLSIHRPNEDHVVVNQKTAEPTEPESRLAYYREDIGMNTHHWAWHVVFPIDETGNHIERKGELFYYVHQQMMARYICERLSNGLNLPVPLQNFREKLGGYAPHLTSQTTGVHFGTRPEGLKMRDLPTFSVQDLEVWRNRIYDAIDNRSVHDTAGRVIPLDEMKGIDILGAIVEASAASVNMEFYGDLHNQGHIMIARVHDPDGRFREYPGVMEFIETSARDPIFYRWHRFIDDIFQRHKATLRPYTRGELSLPGIKIVSAHVRARQVNVIETFITEDHADLSHAPFLRTNRVIKVKYERLEHEPFSYSFNIENNTGQGRDVTVRVFMGPKYDVGGNALDLNEQRRLMIELDKFHRHLWPGANAVERHSVESSVTLRHRGYAFATLKSGNYEPTVDYCSCGWPDHMLVPRGTNKGLDFMLFVMCTDYHADTFNTGPLIVGCNDAISYCGTKDLKYPDTKPMGFPFDRILTQCTIEQFLTENMAVGDVKMKFMGFVPQSVKEWTVKETVYGDGDYA